MNARRPRGPERVAVVRESWGILLMFAPRRVLDSVSGAHPTPVTRVLARVVGLRHLVQASVALVGSDAAQRAWWIDVLHATSMLAVVVAAPVHRRLATTDATVAATFAVANARANN